MGSGVEELNCKVSVCSGARGSRRESMQKKDVEGCMDGTQKEQRANKQDSDAHGNERIDRGVTPEAVADERA